MVDERIIKMTLHEAELTLASVRNDISTQGFILSDSYKEIEACKNTLDVLKEENRLERVKIQEERNAIASERAEIELGRKRMQEAKEWYQSALKEVEQQQKLAIKDLEWVNDKVFKAEAEVEQLKIFKLSLEKEIEQKRKISEEILRVENEIVSLEKVRDELLRDCTLTKGNADSHLEKSKLELLEIIRVRDSAFEERNQAEYALKNYQDQLTVMKSNFSIYVKRLEAYYKTDFPDLVINLI